jgi:hypothetical protein
MKIFLRVLVLLCLSILVNQSLSAQSASAAVQAVNAWRAGAIRKLNGQSLDTYNAVGVSVGKLANGDLKVVFVVSVSQDIAKLGSLTFSAQPVQVMPSSGGTILKLVNEPSKIKTGGWERENISDEIAASPELTMSADAEANAVKLTVYGLGTDSLKPYTFILPIGPDPRSAALGSVGFTFQTAKLVEGKCIWYLGYCQFGCDVMCIGCSDNSPTLNCVTCSMGCANGQPCTPTTPKPVECTGE